MVSFQEGHKQQKHTLFPYTTLFRSRRAPQACPRSTAGSPPRSRPCSDRHVRWCRDRKSTRLNSSHSSTSYAVFCLKKKRRRITIPLTLSNLKLLRRITRPDNILHRN